MLWISAWKDLGAEVGDLNLPDLETCALKHVDDKEIETAAAAPEKQAGPEADA